MDQKATSLVKRFAKRFVDPDVGHEADKDLIGKVRRDQLDLAYRNSWANILVNLAAGAGLLVMFWVQGEVVLNTLLWFAAVLAVCLVRLWSGFRYYKLRQKTPELDDRDYKHWYQEYVAGVLIAVVLWAVIGVLQIPNVRSESQFLTLIIFSGLAGGATGILAPIFIVGRVYLVILLLPPAILLLAMSGLNYILAILAIIFLFVMLFTHRNNHVVLFRSLILHHRNEGLVEDLRHKNRITEDWNAKLEARVALRTEELRNLVVHDTLTGLLNRDGIVEWFDEVCGRGGDLDFAVLFIDLDHFKQINDGLSHAIGDEVLRVVGARLRQFGGSQHAVGRWGGDEFLMVLAAPIDDLHSLVMATIKKTRDSVNQPINISGHTLHVGFSTGVAFAAGHNPGISELIHWADLAAAEVKREGRGNVHNYDSTLLVEQERRLNINQALRRAVQGNEFYLAYQPVVRAKDGAITSYEVLLRWNSAELGAITPDEFIPIAEESAQIVGIGEWVLHEACATLNSWQDISPTTKVAVNVSIRQIVVPNFARMVEGILRETGLSANRLILEVTESIFDQRQIMLIADVLSVLHDMGIEVHIDDFGTGYSSLSRLHQIRVDAVKIDKSFVLKMDENARVVIEGAILIAHRFGLNVIAEGVETDQQRAELASMGVDAYQGYFFARPAKGPCLDPHWQAKKSSV